MLCLKTSLVNKNDCTAARTRLGVFARLTTKSIQCSIVVYISMFITSILIVTPITMKSILASGPLKTKLIIINFNNHDKKPIANSKKDTYLLYWIR